MREPFRYIGIDLSGAKSHKTSVAILEHYPKEKKVFLLELYDHLAGHEDQSGDEALLEVIREIGEGALKIGVNVPLDLPPCIGCTRKSCPMPHRCTVTEVKWMREAQRKSQKRGQKLDRSREFTPYTQRPIELWIRHSVLGHLKEYAQVDVDEALGGNKAPLTSRMNFLLRHLPKTQLLEIWPKVSIAVMAKSLGVTRRTLHSYRRLEEGNHARAAILELIIKEHGIFIYERDQKKLAESLSCFDAFCCAYTALLSDLGRCAKRPKTFPAKAGWVEYPVWQPT